MCCPRCATCASRHRRRRDGADAVRAVRALRQPRQRRDGAGHAIGADSRRGDPAALRQRSPRRGPQGATLARWRTKQARRTVGEFLGADPNGTWWCSRRTRPRRSTSSAESMPIDDGAVVLTTVLEHHSNDLPWRARVPNGARRCGAPTAGWISTTSTVSSPATPVGSRCWSSRERRTSPVWCRPIHDLADGCTPSAGESSSTPPNSPPHRPIDMRPHDDPGHLDFVALSAHKMYAPVRQRRDRRLPRRVRGRAGPGRRRHRGRVVR